jgi:hypothetical protein
MINITNRGAGGLHLPLLREDGLTTGQVAELERAGRIVPSSESFGRDVLLRGGGSLSVPRWYARRLLEMKGWAARLRTGEIVVDGAPPPSHDDSTPEVIALKDQLAAAATGRQRAEARVRELEAELDGVRATTRKQVAELEAQLEAARKPAPKPDDKPKADKPKKDEKPEG